MSVDLSQLRPGSIVIGRRNEKDTTTWWAYRVGEAKSNPRGPWWRNVHTADKLPVMDKWLPRNGRWTPVRYSSFDYNSHAICVFTDPKEGQDAIDVLQGVYDSMWEKRREGENAMRVALKLIEN